MKTYVNEVEVKNKEEAPQNFLPKLTKHARERSQRRKFSLAEIAYVMEHGRLLYRTGVRFYFLGNKDLPLKDRNLPWAQHLVGTTLLVSGDGPTLITLYKNPKGLGDIKRKSKFRRIMPEV